MKDQFVPYELAVKLKELGFNEKCITSYCRHWKDLEPYLWDVGQPDYDNHWDLSTKVSAPLWQQAFDWFRKEHKLEGVIQMYTYTEYCFTIYSCKEETILEHIPMTNIYEEAREACLIKLIESV